jgi:hypothetical protein
MRQQHSQQSEQCGPCPHRYRCRRRNCSLTTNCLYIIIYYSVWIHLSSLGWALIAYKYSSLPFTYSSRTEQDHETRTPTSDFPCLSAIREFPVPLPQQELTTGRLGLTTLPQFFSAEFYQWCVWSSYLHLLWRACSDRHEA